MVELRVELRLLRAEVRQQVVAGHAVLAELLAEGVEVLGHLPLVGRQGGVRGLLPAVLHALAEHGVGGQGQQVAPQHAVRRQRDRLAVLAEAGDRPEGQSFNLVPCPTRQ